MKQKNILNILTFFLMSLVVGQLFATLIDVSPVYPVVTLLAAGLIPFNTSGILAVAYGNMVWSGGNNMGGCQALVYYSPLSGIDNFPELPAAPSTDIEEVTLESVTGFTMKATEVFYTIEPTLETIQVTDEPQGETDGKSFVHKGSLFFPGTTVEAMAFAKKANNDRLVFVFLEPDGTRRVVGSKAFPAHCTVQVDTGMKTADRKGATIEVVSYGVTPAPFYTGTLPLV